MSLWRLAVRGVSFYWRTNLAVVLAVIVATGVLTGALAVGDSVRYTLRKTLEARLGRVQFAILPQGRFFRAALADDLEQQLGGTVAPVLQVVGIITNDDGSQRVNRVQVLGVTDKFYAVGSGESPDRRDVGEGVVLSEAVARRLGAVAGDEVVLRIEKPGLLPHEVPLASDKDRTVASRLKVQAIADDSMFGRFDLQANQTSALNVFVPLAWLGQQIEQPGRANMLLAAHLKNGITAPEARAAIQKVWRPADAGLELGRLPERNVLELRSRRVFIDEPIGAQALKAGTIPRGEGVPPLRLAGIWPAEGKQGQDVLAAAPGRATGVLTYFVNEVRLGDKTTPYSMVAALDSVPLGGGEIIINQWLADDLGAKVGDSVDLSYFVIGPQRRLQEEHSRLKVAGIVPMDDPVCDPKLMPAFPGLADVNNCRDWRPGIPIDLGKIRPKDEQYWQEHRGTPKAFVSLETGQQLWHNQYGSLTAVRYPWREGLAQQIEQRLMSTIDPALVGLFFQPIRARGMQASSQGTDFGELFLGLSMFLIAAAVILIGLLFVFGIESRSQQVGMLMAVGWPARRVRRLLLAEGGLVALCGTIIGVAVGLLYTRLMVYALATLWSGAVGGTGVYFHAKLPTLVSGGLGGLLAVLFAIWLTLRKQAIRPARVLMAGGLEEGPERQGQSVRGDVVRRFFKCPYGHTTNGLSGIGVAVVAFLGVAIILLVTPTSGGEAVAGAFFGAGALLLIGTLSLSRAMLRMAGGSARPMISLQGLGLRNTTRRSGRSVATIGVLACGVFLVVGVWVFRQGPVENPQTRESGTGGFALYGESSVSILHDLSTESGRKQLGLAGQSLDDVQAVQFRVHDGDDASCLNLNRAQQPRLLGVPADALTRREAFRFIDGVKGAGQEQGWGLLRIDDLGRGIVPAVGDERTIKWGLHKNIGDEIEYTDERGRPFRVRIVGMLASSVLQGSLIIAENEFITRFPSVDGYRVFLIDAPAERADAVTQKLSSGLRDYGLMLTPTQERLAEFSAVENTYL
ncbi:MAG: ABC transporter permease [Planctomycetes bacterium]|nr:ABC transporter permease [Planctomycetota bacterium]